MSEIKSGSEKNKYWDIKNATSESADLYLYSPISSWGEDWGDTGAKDVIKAIKDLGDISELNIYINSPGGSVSEGMAIRAFLARQSFKKNVYIDSLCASIATAIAFGIGATVRMNSFALVMIHKAWSWGSGNADDFRKMADTLDKHDYTIRSIYTNRCKEKLTEDELNDMMSAETWLTAQECLDYGFIDEIAEESAPIAACIPDDYLARYKNIPAALREAKTKSRDETNKMNSEMQAVIDKANIEVVNGQIQGYEDLKESMDAVIESQRKQAKLDYLQDSYVDAIYNKDLIKEQLDGVIAERKKAEKELEDINEKGRKAEEAYEAYWNNPDNFSFKDYGFKDLEEIDAARYFDTFDLEHKVSEFKIQQESLQSTLDAYWKTISEYESIAFDPENNSVKPKVAADSFVIDPNEVERNSKEQLELAARGVKQSWEDLVAELEGLDNDLAIKNVSEEDYWAERRKLLEDSPYREKAEWHALYDKVIEYYDKLAETEKKAQEEALKKQHESDKRSLEDKIDALKLKAEVDESYTKEMMYNEMETLISGLDKENELYNKYNEEIIKGRKSLADETSKALKEGLKSDITEIENQIKTVTSKYQNDIKKLLSDKESYFNKLFDTSKFTSRTSTTINGKEAEAFTLSDPGEAYKDLVAYENAVQKLQAKGVSQNVISWIDTLDQQTAKDTIDVLNNMTDSKLKTYSDNFDKYKEKAMSMAASKYDPQIEELNKGFIEQVNALLGALPGKASETGVQTAQGFISGLLGSGGDISDAVNQFTSDVITKIKEGLDINSPSKETESLGEYTAKGFVNGFNSESMAGAAGDFADSFIAKLAEKDPEIRAALDSTFTGNMTDVMNNMDKLTTDSLNKVATALTGKMAQLPDVTKLSVPAVQVAETVTASADAASFEELNTKIDTLISIMQSFVAAEQTEQRIKLELDLDGRLTADMNNITAIISKKFNDLSIQTGRTVYSY